jgi:putative flippase GtrA
MIIPQFIKFFVNGGIIGIISLALQAIIYRATGLDSSLAYALASALTYVPLIVINFIIQRKWIFQRVGMFWRFVLANLTIMLLVSLFAPLCRLLITWYAGAEWGDRGGFALAAVALSIPSFFLNSIFVFGARHDWK